MALPRQILKDKFLNGSRPSQKDFYDLIDSDINSEDDGIVFFADGIKLTKPGADDKKGSAYQVQFGGINRNTLEFHYENDDSGAWLSIAAAGISTKGLTSDISTKSIISDGQISMCARRGNFTQKNVLNPPPKQPGVTNPAVGNDLWQTILYTSKICQAYEVVAQLVGDNQSMLVACASTSESQPTDRGTDIISLLSRFVYTTTNFIKKILGISNTRIHVTQSYSHGFWDGIKMKWVEGHDSYSLQVKAGSGQIYYSITQLWGAGFISPKN